MLVLYYLEILLSAQIGGAAINIVLKVPNVPNPDRWIESK